MIQIAICDDSEVSLQNLNQAVTDILKSNHELAEITLYRESKFLNYDINEGHFYDLILTDIQMPHIDGMELAANIAKTFAKFIDYFYYRPFQICIGCI